ncbi:MAG: alpha-mannosidase [Anaerolineae bacterium]|jgi:alpha-mannosidase|nr:alpha-mannosidase [Anaerolineae bacterium]MBT4311132.1 alpha-mannosidase [Anaerolineae bacterium]MBT4457579.1 alpha-mannosidase [Anaerolineae bacterium]MBT4841746.1 alpha-mannosidase [Anaerolineae bacterium]MBT6059634.1 alpha-mannosidase [Anaerolineae bacterium]
MRHQIRWTSKKIHQRLALVQNFVYRQRQSLAPFRYKKLDSPLSPPPISVDVDDGDWDVILPNDYWGLPRVNFALRTRFNFPDEWLATAKLALFLPLGISGDFSHPEALAYIDGVPYASADRHHQEIILPEKFRNGKTHTLTLHGWTGIGGSTVGDATKKLQMKTCEVVQIDQPTRDFIATARVTLEIADHLDENDPARHHLYIALDASFKKLNLRIPVEDSFYQSISPAHKILKDGINLAGAPLNVDITAVGHAHLDVAWLWTLSQTRRKAERTFHNVIRLMEEFPDFHFTQSQPHLYEVIREDHPQLFSEIKKRISEKKWEPIGGMWVEADCNISGSESLARQFLLGRNYFREHFGKDAESPVLWLPDVFGYAWNLPQLIKEAGLEYFFTIKIGWSQYNRFPYDSFWWKGLDGTRILTHFSTTKKTESVFAATYNSDASPDQTLGTWRNFQQKDYGDAGRTPPLLMSYGWGDGGGGPTREMIENIREMGEFPSTPQIHTGRVDEFFCKLENDVGGNLPTWNGELYLEYHRGTYTTQARNKRANRKSEFLLHDTEFLAAYASQLDADYQYPHAEFTEAWKLVALNQFHDIIPGSSIKAVYEDSLKQYEEVRQIVEKARNMALDAIAKKMGSKNIIINPTSFTRNEVLEVNGETIQTGDLSPYSVKTLNLKPSNLKPSLFNISPKLLENNFLRVELNADGDITRIYDKIAEREVLAENEIANQLQAFEDIPINWDAWDIEIFYDDKMWLAEAATSVSVVESNALRATLEIKRRILNSDYIQRISLQHNSPRLNFETTIQWRERKILLKVAFPVDILSPTATYEIQWGNVERPTHRNTSWDWARFETAAQKWVDLSEGDYGVSLLNDCKYGHDIRDNIMRLTLLRGTTAPDPDADLGEHQFSYSLYPHSGGWDERTIAEAYALNDPILFYQADVDLTKASSLKCGAESFIQVDQPNIVIETVKKAEDGEGYIIRLYESQRKRGAFTLTTNFPLTEAWRANILEENLEEIPVKGLSLKYAIKPYQILTLRLLPAI